MSSGSSSRVVVASLPCTITRICSTTYGLASVVTSPTSRRFEIAASTRRIIFPQRAVAGHERPVAPVFAFRIPVVLAEVCLHVAIAVAPDRLHDPRPGIADTDVAGFPGALRDLRAGLIVNDRMNPRHGWAAASRLHRMNRRHRAAEESAGLGHPPRVGDDGFA